MIKLILVRHGKTTCNEKGALSGLTDSVLSETGKLQSQKIADYLKYTNIDKIYTTPFKRTKETILIGSGLVILSILLHYLHVVIFKDVHHTMIFLFADIAFIPLEVFLTSTTYNLIFSLNLYFSLGICSFGPIAVSSFPILTKTFPLSSLRTVPVIISYSFSLYSP